MLLLMTLPAINATNYELVTSTDDLKAGARYVIAAIKENYAISKTQNDNNRAAVAIVKSGTTISLADNVAVFTLRGSKDAWTFYDEEKSGYLYAPSEASKKQNWLRTSGDENTYSGKNTCKISLDAETNTAHIVFNINDSYANTLVLNGTTIFSCYTAKTASGTNYKQLCLYKEVVEAAAFVAVGAASVYGIQTLARKENCILNKNNKLIQKD